MSWQTTKMCNCLVGLGANSCKLVWATTQITKIWCGIFIGSIILSQFHFGRNTRYYKLLLHFLWLSCVLVFFTLGLTIQIVIWLLRKNVFKTATEFEDQLIFLWIKLFLLEDAYFIKKKILDGKGTLCAEIVVFIFWKKTCKAFNWILRESLNFM